MNNVIKILNSIAQSIYDKKGFNIFVLDVRNISNMTDYLVIAEGTVDRHVKAISQAITETVKPLGYRPWHTEGSQNGDWIVVDFGDIVVHLFIPELREKYALEELWKKGSIIDVNINTKQLENNGGIYA
jgi:ribosome-associated protein